MKSINILIIFCAMSIGLSAQNDVQFTHFMFNKLGYNPAFAGYDDALTVGAIYREQWVNLEGAPRTMRAQVHTPFAGGRNGIGLSLTSDKIGWMNTNSIDLSYAYRIPFGKYKLSLGVSGRLDNATADWTSAKGYDPIDGALPVGETTMNLPNFGAGVTFSGEHFYVSASIPQFMNNPNFQFSDLPDEKDFAMRTTYLMGGAEFSVAKNVKFMPTLLASYNPNAPFDLDANLGFLFMNTFYTGVTYRLDDSFDFLLMYQLTPQWKVGGAYDFTTSGLRDKTPGSFEFMTSYTFDYTKEAIRNLRFF